MQALPHHYVVRASSDQTGDIDLRTDGVPRLVTAGPAQFDGPGDRWSPETLLVGAIADCFILTFRAIARASKFEWRSLECSVEGRLDRVEKGLRFTELDIHASLVIPPDVDRERAERLLEKAERNCLVSRSLNAEFRLRTSIETAADAALTTP